MSQINRWYKKVKESHIKLTVSVRITPTYFASPSIDKLTDGNTKKIVGNMKVTDGKAKVTDGNTNLACVIRIKPN